MCGHPATDSVFLCGEKERGGGYLSSDSLISACEKSMFCKSLWNIKLCAWVSLEKRFPSPSTHPNSKWGEPPPQLSLSFLACVILGTAFTSEKDLGRRERDPECLSCTPNWLFGAPLPSCLGCPFSFYSNGPVTKVLWGGQGVRKLSICCVAW